MARIEPSLLPPTWGSGLQKGPGAKQCFRGWGEGKVGSFKSLARIRKTCLG